MNDLRLKSNELKTRLSVNGYLDSKKRDCDVGRKSQRPKEIQSNVY